MDCKTFACKHAAFIDDTLPGVDMTAMRDHVAVCVGCARRDADVRRALLVLKNLPRVQVSEGFQDRLRARISVEDRSSRGAPIPGVRSWMKWSAAAALAIVVGGVAAGVGAVRRDVLPARLPAVVAFAPMAVGHELDDSAPVYVASMSTGIPMWPALMLAEEGPLRFATAELQGAAWEASRPHD